MSCVVLRALLCWLTGVCGLLSLIALIVWLRWHGVHSSARDEPIAKPPELSGPIVTFVMRPPPLVPTSKPYPQTDTRSPRATIVTAPGRFALRSVVNSQQSAPHAPAWRSVRTGWIRAAKPHIRVPPIQVKYSLLVTIRSVPRNM